MTLEQELIEVFASTSSQRNREILIGYYGWEDGRQHTLTEIGAQFGITRERVRQVCAKTTKRLTPPITIRAPAMDRALALVAERLPVAAVQIEAHLAAEGLTRIGLSIESLMVGAKLLGRPVGFRIVKITDGPSPSDSRLVIRPDQLDAVLAAIDQAKKEVYFHGLATVKQIAQAISKPPLVISQGGGGCEQLVRQTLMLMDGFCWLDEPAGWFRLLGIEKHGLPKAIDKVLAVAGAVTAAQLRAAPGRNRRLWKELPPEGVLLGFCRQMAGVRVEGGRIISDPPRDWKNALTGVEAKLVETLLAHGPVMERGAMEDLCVADGMNRFSFHAFISWSPVITPHGHSLYGLLGTEVTPQQVEELRAQRRANRVNHRVLDRHGRTDDGRVWLSYRLSKAASTYAVITVPAALKKVVRGRFQLLSPQGRPVGHLATKDGRAWGLGAFLRQAGHGSATGSSLRSTWRNALRPCRGMRGARGGGRGTRAANWPTGNSCEREVRRGLGESSSGPLGAARSLWQCWHTWRKHSLRYFSTGRSNVSRHNWNATIWSTKFGSEGWTRG